MGLRSIGTVDRSFPISRLYHCSGRVDVAGRPHVVATRQTAQNGRVTMGVNCDKMQRLTMVDPSFRFRDPRRLVGGFLSQENALWAAFKR
jgi:hypothetical protein